MTNDAPAQASVEARAEAAWDAISDGPNKWHCLSLDERDTFVQFAEALALSPPPTVGAWPKDPETGLNDLSLGTLLRKTREEASAPPTVGAEDEAPVAWRLVDRQGDHWWGPSMDRRQAERAASCNDDLVLQPLYATRPAPAAVDGLRVKALETAISDAVDFLGRFRGAGMDTVIDKLEACLATTADGGADG